MISVSHTEEGKDFITLYVLGFKDIYTFGKLAYDKLMKREDFLDKHLQVKDFGHDDPMNPCRFHTDGDAGKRYGAEGCKHIHIRYDRKPTKEDWDYLYQHLNDRDLGIELKRDLPHRIVEQKFCTMDEIYNPNLKFDEE